MNAENDNVMNPQRPKIYIHMQKRVRDQAREQIYTRVERQARRRTWFQVSDAGDDLVGNLVIDQMLDQIREDTP